MGGLQFYKCNYSDSKYSVESVSGKYLENGLSDQHGDFSVEFVIEKLTTLSSECIKFNGYMRSSYRDICVKVTPQSIWIHCKVFLECVCNQWADVVP